MSVSSLSITVYNDYRASYLYTTGSVSQYSMIFLKLGWSGGGGYVFKATLARREKNEKVQLLSSMEAHM